MSTDELIIELKNLYWATSSKASSVTNKEESIRLQNACKLVTAAKNKIEEQADLIKDLQLLTHHHDWLAACEIAKKNTQKMRTIGLIGNIR